MVYYNGHMNVMIVMVGSWRKALGPVCCLAVIIVREAIKYYFKENVLCIYSVDRSEGDL